MPNWQIPAQPEGGTTAGPDFPDLPTYSDARNQFFIGNLLIFEYQQIHFETFCEFLTGQMNLSSEPLLGQMLFKTPCSTVLEPLRCHLVTVTVIVPKKAFVEKDCF